MSNLQGVYVCAAFLPVNKKLLVCQRDAKRNDPLKWELPGGKLNPDEKFEDALIREVHEELDIDIKIIEEVGSVQVDKGNEAIMVMFVLVEADSSKIKLKEHNDMKFVNFDELKKLDLCDADKLFVNTYEAEIRKYIN